MKKADWTNGICYVSDAAPEVPAMKKSARMTIASDWLPRGPHEQLIEENPLAVYGDLLPLLRSSDLNVVNVEGGIGDSGHPIVKSGPNLRMTERAVRSLVEAPFHVGCLANNHILDYGTDNLRNTLNILRKEGLQTVGAGLNGAEAARPLINDLGASKVAIINCAEGEACRSLHNGPGAYGFETTALVRQVRELKQEADIVLVIFHGGREYVPLPPEYVVDGLRAAADAGASAVIAHHPHVPQGIELYGNVPIVYSQGNFVFWMDKDSFYQHAGYLVHLDVCGDCVTKLEVTPYLIEEDGLSVMKEEMKNEFMHTLETISKLLTDRQQVRDGWHAFVESVGISSMAGRLEKAISELKTHPESSAALLLNSFKTPAHRELYISGMRRVVDGQLGDVPEWAETLVDHWLNCHREEGKRQYGVPVPDSGFLHRLLNKPQ